MLIQEPVFRRGTKAVASIEYTSSPRWLVPALRACRMPHCGRFSDVRFDSMTLVKLMVSPIIVRRRDGAAAE